MNTLLATDTSLRYTEHAMPPTANEHARTVRFGLITIIMRVDSDTMDTETIVSLHRVPLHSTALRYPKYTDTLPFYMR